MSGIAQLAGLVQSTARVAREVMVEVTVEVTYQNVISLFVKYFKKERKGKSPCIGSENLFIKTIVCPF